MILATIYVACYLAVTMSVQECPVVVDCDCSDSPILNRTQDPTDSAIYIGECWFCGILIGDEPPLERIEFKAQGCKSWAFSTVSQAIANALAAAQDALCNDGGGGGGPVPPWIPTNPTVIRLNVGNEAQGVSCANGEDMTSTVALPSNLSITGPTLTVAANSFTADSQQNANALAATYVTDYFNAHFASGDLICENCFFDEDCEDTGTPVGWTDGSGGGNLVNWDYSGVILDGTESLLLRRAAGSVGTLIDLGPADELWLRFRLYFTAYSQFVISFQDNSLGSACYLEVLATGQIKMDNFVNTLTTASAMSIGVAYNVWVHVRKEPAGIMEAGFSVADEEPVSGGSFASFAQGTGLAIVRIRFDTFRTSDTVLDDLKCCPHSIGDFP